MGNERIHSLDGLSGTVWLSSCRKNPSNAMGWHKYLQVWWVAWMGRILKYKTFSFWCSMTKKSNIDVNLGIFLSSSKLKWPYSLYHSSPFVINSFANSVTTSIHLCLTLSNSKCFFCSSVVKVEELNTFLKVVSYSYMVDTNSSGSEKTRFFNAGGMCLWCMRLMSRGTHQFSKNRNEWYTEKPV